MAVEFCRSSYIQKNRTAPDQGLTRLDDRTSSLKEDHHPLQTITSVACHQFRWLLPHKLRGRRSPPCLRLQSERNRQYEHAAREEGSACAETARSHYLESSAHRRGRMSMHACHCCPPA